MVPVPLLPSGTGLPLEWSGVDPTCWLSPTFPSPPGTFNFQQQALIERRFEGERMETSFMVLFNDQDPVPGGPSAVAHPDNNLVSILFGKLPIKWKGNVLVLRIGGYGRSFHLKCGGLTTEQDHRTNFDPKGLPTAVLISAVTQQGSILTVSGYAPDTEMLSLFIRVLPVIFRIIKKSQHADTLEPRYLPFEGQQWFPIDVDSGTKESPFDVDWWTYVRENPEHSFGIKHGVTITAFEQELSEAIAVGLVAPPSAGGVKVLEKRERTG
ncbi:hypothetical protein R3P38DRAFT_2775084 [Favolaschia claudopus]|uniref:Uncharacterized protein n=1 Tax=Favolaschia claudopus TaxID=2862362 RepID=A0AAW0BVL1_9AGAR